MKPYVPQPIVLRQKGDCYSVCVQFVPTRTGMVDFGKISGPGQWVSG